MEVSNEKVKEVCLETANQVRRQAFECIARGVDNNDVREEDWGHGILYGVTMTTQAIYRGITGDNEILKYENVLPLNSQ